MEILNVPHIELHLYNVEQGERETEHRRKGLVSVTYSSRGSSCSLGGLVGSSVVHDVSPRTAADYLTPRQVHVHPPAAPSSVMGHAMRCHHSGHLR